MSRIRCNCGNVIRDVESPCADLLLALPDEKIATVVAQVVKSKDIEHPADLVNAAIANSSIPLYRCSVCGRLLVFWNGSDVGYSSYLPDSDGKSNQP